MENQKFKCVNLANCDKALSGDIIELQVGEEQVCPDCGRPLEKIDFRGGGGGSNWPKIVLFAVAALIVIGVIGGLTWYFWPSGEIVAPPKDTEVAIKQFAVARDDAPEFQEIKSLIKKGIVREGKDGLLTPGAAEVDWRQAQLLQDENNKRKEAIASIAETTKPKRTPNEIAEILGKRFTANPCRLTPARDTDVTRLVLYMKQGMMYAEKNKPNEALAEFRQGVAIDPNFISLHMDSGTALLVLKKYEDAESSFRSLQKKKEQALAALEEALKSGYNNRKHLESDLDLAFIRTLPEFQKIVKANI